MATRKPKTDKRLLGTWKSDRRRTFKDFVPPRRLRGRKLNRFKTIFGKLTVRYTRHKVHSDYEGSLQSVDYELLGSDADSVVIMVSGQVPADSKIQHIHFEGKYYWISLEGLREYFRRVD
jgi:hypothetical protein